MTIEAVTADEILTTPVEDLARTFLVSAAEKGRLIARKHVAGIDYRAGQIQIEIRRDTPPRVSAKLVSSIDWLRSHGYVSQTQPGFYDITTEGFDWIKGPATETTQRPKMSGKQEQTTFEGGLSTYRTVRPIGQGGAGRVFEVVDEEGSVYALKLLDRDAGTAQKIKRFKNEIFFGLRHQHPNVISVVDYSPLKQQDSPLFYVMKLHGTSLRTLIAAGIPLEDVLPYFGCLLEGLKFAHERDVWHRDLKPENVLLNTNENQLVVADFGIAHFAEDLLHTAVETGSRERLANFQYAAPEQRIRGREVDQRADIFAAGLILNEMFTGVVPHGTSPRSIGSVAPQYRHLDALVEHMTRQAPEERPASVGEVQSELELLRGGDALLYARRVNELLATKKERERLFHSEEGVRGARDAARAVFRQIAVLADNVRETSPHIQVQHATNEREDFQVLRGRRFALRVHWYYQLTNSLEDARFVVLETKGWTPLPIAEERNLVPSVEPVELANHEFFPDYAQKWLWRPDKSTDRLTSEQLADRVVLLFLDLVVRFDPDGDTA